MKKKVCCVLIVLCMVLGLTACGAKGDVMSVAIGGKTYNLSEDVQDIIGMMVDDGILAVDFNTQRLYDEEGKVSDKRMIDMINEDPDGKMVVYISEIPANPSPDYNPIVSQYMIGCEEIEYKTIHGIGYKSDEKSIKSLDGYIPYTARINAKNMAYAALYIDGSLVDLEEYEDLLEDLLKDAEETNLMRAVREYMPESTYYPQGCSFLINPETPTEIYDEDAIEGSLLLALAAQEAGELLSEGDIDSYDIIVYEKHEDGMQVAYYHYFYDDNWQLSKFYKHR